MSQSHAKKGEQAQFRLAVHPEKAEEVNCNCQFFIFYKLDQDLNKSLLHWLFDR